MSNLTPSNASPVPSGLILVEPDILVRMVLAEYLRECGYHVIEGISAEDVLAVLGVGKGVDVVLTEVRLGGSMDGFALSQHLRQHYPDISVILTSSAAKSADKAGDLCEEGPLEKPYHPQEIVRRIKLLRERVRTTPI